jgi:malate dehydrogenase (oxaloacetate-decarboxylating)
MDINKEALSLHKRLHGKLAMHSKIHLKTKIDLALTYTPGVAVSCKEIAADKSKVYNYTIKGNTVAIISDGSAVLGLGNIGAEAALPVMEGKAILFKEFAGINAFPICLKSQDVHETIETIKNIAPVFGGINLEDFKAPECFEIENALQDLGIPVMHDDQHGTAVVALAALINAIRLREIEKEKAKIIIVGAGAAGIAIARLLLAYGFKNIIMVNSKGIVHKQRTDLSEEQAKIAHITNLENKSGDLSEALRQADIFIGVSTGNILKKEMIRLMNPKPIIFALANPTPEIMPSSAKEAGAFIVATGRSDFPNQINNVLAFPGIFKGALEIKAQRITQKMKLAAAQALAALVNHPTPNKIIPGPFDRHIVPVIANAVKSSWQDSEQN